MKTRNLLDEIKLTQKEQQKIFNTALHSDTREGKVFFTTLLNGEMLSEVSSSDIESMTSISKAGNTYVSLNTFSKDERTSKNAYNIGAFFLDLDGHNLSDAELFLAKENTKRLLSQAVDMGLLCQWSMLTDSGRGLGLYILLGQSIPVYGRNSKSVRFYNAIYRMLIDRVQMILDSCPDATLSVDTNVKDRARLCRLPGTYNYKAHTECELLEYNVDNMEEVLRYSLWDIVLAAGLTWDAKEKEKKETFREEDGKDSSVSVHVKNIEKCLKDRQRKLELLQTLRDDWNGFRETYCFAYYNCVKQLYGPKHGKALLFAFNKNFPDGGITEYELENICKSVEKNVNPDGHYGGFYKLTEEWICNSLQVDADEKRICHFGQKSEALLHHERVVSARIENHKNVVRAIITNDSWNAVAEETGLALRTVKKIGKQYGCSMRKKPETDSFDWDQIERDMLCRNKRKEEENIEPETEPAQIPELGIFDAIQMEIEEDNFEDAHASAVFSRHPYGLSFLSYAMDHTTEMYHAMIEDFMDTISSADDRQMLEKLLNAVDYMASQYVISPSFEAAAYDLSYTALAFRNGHLDMRIHGQLCKSVIYTKKNEYPEEYMPSESMSERLDTYKNVFRTAGASYLAAVKRIQKFYKSFSRNSHNGNLIIKLNSSTTVKINRTHFLKQMNCLNIYELSKIVKTCANRSLHGHGIPFSFLVKQFYRVFARYRKEMENTEIAEKFVKTLFPQINGKKLVNA